VLVDGDDLISPTQTQHMKCDKYPNQSHTISTISGEKINGCETLSKVMHKSSEGDLLTHPAATLRLAKFGFIADLYQLPIEPNPKKSSVQTSSQP
jgi:hypothetical protein